MSEVKRYHVTEAGLVEGSALGRINVVLGADHDRVTAERDALQALLTAADERVDLLEGLLRRAKSYGGLTPAWHDAVEGALKPAEGRGKSESIGGKCWSCKEPVTLIEWVETDGNCPHCNVEIDEAEGIKP